MEDLLFIKFFGTFIIVLVIGAFTFGMLESYYDYKETLAQIQQCKCMEVQK